MTFHFRMQPVYRKYEKLDLERALTSINNCDMGFKSAARWYGASKTTLLRHYKCRNNMAKQEQFILEHTSISPGIAVAIVMCASLSSEERGMNEIVKHVLDLQQTKD